MPCNYKEYPANWFTEIRPAVLKRADNCCEQCKVPNYAIGIRDKFSKWHDEKDIQRMNGLVRFALFGTETPRLIKIVLTIAHLDHDHDNKNVSLDRLRAWCQRCHLRYDRDKHRETRNNKKSTNN